MDLSPAALPQEQLLRQSPVARFIVQAALLPLRAALLPVRAALNFVLAALDAGLGLVPIWGGIPSMPALLNCHLEGSHSGASRSMLESSWVWLGSALLPTYEVHELGASWRWLRDD